MTLIVPDIYVLLVKEDHLIYFDSEGEWLNLFWWQVEQDKKSHPITMLPQKIYLATQSHWLTVYSAIDSREGKFQRMQPPMS